MDYDQAPAIFEDKNFTASQPTKKAYNPPQLTVLNISESAGGNQAAFENDNGPTGS